MGPALSSNPHKPDRHPAGQPSSFLRHPPAASHRPTAPGGCPRNLNKSGHGNQVHNTRSARSAAPTDRVRAAIGFRKPDSRKGQGWVLRKTAASWEAICSGTLGRDVEVQVSLSKVLALRRTVVVGGAIIGFWMSSAAWAETVDLSCAGASVGSDLYVSVNTDDNSVEFWSIGTNRDQSQKSPANISDQQVTWTWTMVTGYPGGLVEKFTYDRNTAALTNIATSNGRTNSNSWTCKRASRVF